MILINFCVLFYLQFPRSEYMPDVLYFPEKCLIVDLPSIWENIVQFVEISANAALSVKCDKKVFMRALKTFIIFITIVKLLVQQT